MSSLTQSPILFLDVPSLWLPWALLLGSQKLLGQLGMRNAGLSIMKVGVI